MVSERRVKIFYIVLVGVLIIISGSLAGNVVHCVTAPCPQPEFTGIAQGVYSLLTFDELLVNTDFALAFKNTIRDILGLSAGKVYLIFNLIISLVLHGVLISLLVSLYSRMKQVRSDSQE